MIAKLEAWDKQLEGAQKFMEEQCRQSQQNVVTDYSEQVMNEVQFLRQVAQVEASMKVMENEEIDVNDGAVGGIGSTIGSMLQGKRK